MAKEVSMDEFMGSLPKETVKTMAKTANISGLKDYLITYNRWDKFHYPMGIGRQIVRADSKIEAILEAQRVFSTLEFKDNSVYSASGFKAELI